MDLHPAEALSLSDWEKPLGVRSNPEGTRDCQKARPVSAKAQGVAWVYVSLE